MRQGDAGGDGNDQMLRGDCCADFVQHLVHELRFHRQNDGVGRFNHIQAAFKGSNAMGFDQVLPPFRQKIENKNMIRPGPSAGDESFDQGLAHVSPADKAICPLRVHAAPFFVVYVIFIHRKPCRENTFSSHPEPASDETLNESLLG